MAENNQLKVVYKDGSTRVIRVAYEFFESVKLFDHKIGKNVEFTARDKAISLADSLGKDPYTIELIRDGREFFAKKYDGNKPIKGRAWIGTNEKKRKKDVRKGFKKAHYVPKNQTT